MTSRGSVLAQVLVMILVGGLIVAGLAQARLQPAMLSADYSRRVADTLATRGALNRVTEVWARGGSCSSDLSAGVYCSGSACSCECDLGAAVVTAAPGPGASCLLTVETR